MADSDEAAKSTENQQTEQVCSFFRKPVNKKNIRKRTVDNEDDEDSRNEGSLLHIQKKSLKHDNKLYFSSSSKNSASAAPSEESEKPVFHFESAREIQVQHDNKATATLETETDFLRDARAIRERALKQAEESLKGKGTSSEGGDKLYKGLNNYKDYKAGFRREQTIASEKAGGSHGPLRASAHIRVSARFDYQPDICKDYKETGYCGYGDSCKFMHDRGDYKSGWQMEKEWEEAEKARKMRLAVGEDAEEEGASLTDEDDEDALPFACFICRNPFADPVVTKCKHYFCEHCALKHHAKNKKCFVCNQPTLGIFNVAHEIRRKMAEEGDCERYVLPSPKNMMGLMTHFI